MRRLGLALLLMVAAAPAAQAQIISGGTGAGGGTGTLTQVNTTSPVAGGPITVSGTLTCPTCTTNAAALTSGQVVVGAGSQAAQVGNLSGDVTTAGSAVTTLKNTGPGVTSCGDTTHSCSATIDIQGRITALSNNVISNAGTVTASGPPLANQVSLFTSATDITGLAVPGTGTYLRGVAASAPIWSTLTLPNAVTTGDLFAGTNTNVMGSIADVATGQGLMSGGVGVLPAWTGAPTFSGTLTANTLAANGATSGSLLLTNVGGSGFGVTLTVGNPAANRTWTLPIIDGSNGQVLSTDGAGVLSFIAAAGTGTVTSVATTAPLAGGTITTTGTLTCATCVVATSPGAGLAHFAGATQTVTSSAIVAADITANTITSTQMAVVNNTRTCSIVVGANNGTALADADLGPQFRQCFIPYAATIVEVTIASDAGTPSIQIRKNVAGTTTNLLSAALAAVGGNGASTIACARSSTSATCYDGTTSSNSITVSTTSLAAGSWIELTSGTAGGTAKELSIAVTYTVN